MSKKFQYSIAKQGVLSDAQRTFYEENGYILIKNNVSHELLDKVSKQFRDICNKKLPSGAMLVMKDRSLLAAGAQGEFLINKIQDFLFDEVLFQYATSKSVVDVIESLIGPNITGVHSMFINKPPDTISAKKFDLSKVDLHYFPFRPAESIAASWTAVERVNQSNGGLYVIPGSHKSNQLYPHIYPNEFKNALYHGVQGFDHLPKVHVEMEAGDTIFFHPLLLHGSGPNLTKGFRKAISVHYADSNCHFIDVRGTSQENIGDEVEKILAKRGIAASYVNIWKMKSRLIRGEPGNFQNVISHL